MNDREAFERFWKRMHPQRGFRRHVWFKRSDIWGRGGYEQPCVHFDWRAFKAGARFARTSRGLGTSP